MQVDCYWDTEGLTILALLLVFLAIHQKTFLAAQLRLHDVAASCGPATGSGCEECMVLGD